MTVRSKWALSKAEAPGRPGVPDAVFPCRPIFCEAPAAPARRCHEEEIMERSEKILRGLGNQYYRATLKSMGFTTEDLKRPDRKSVV